MPPASSFNFAPRSIEIARDYRYLTPEGGVGFGWQTQDLHPAGACGDAAAADAARGGVVVERAADSLLALIDEVARYPLDAITHRTRFDKP